MLQQHSYAGRQLQCGSPGPSNTATLTSLPRSSSGSCGHAAVPAGGNSMLAEVKQGRVQPSHLMLRASQPG